MLILIALLTVALLVGVWLWLRSLILRKAERQAEAERRIELERQAETERQAEADRNSKPAERTGEVQRIVSEYGAIAPARSTHSGDREPGKLKQDGQRPQHANTAPADLRL